ncbi:hypothetical protein BD311DRAFT_750455, partial [Dichomitus squalens]
MSGGADRLGWWLPLVRSAPSAYGDDGDCFFLLPPLERSNFPGQAMASPPPLGGHYGRTDSRGRSSIPSF